METSRVMLDAGFLGSEGPRSLPVRKQLSSMKLHLSRALLALTCIAFHSDVAQSHTVPDDASAAGTIVAKMLYSDVYRECVIIFLQNRALSGNPNCTESNDEITNTFKKFALDVRDDGNIKTIEGDVIIHLIGLYKIWPGPMNRRGLAIVGLASAGALLCAATPLQADALPPSKYRMIYKIFVGAHLVDCGKAVGISRSDCQSTQDYLGYATWQLAAAASAWRWPTIPSNWVGANEIDDLLKYRSPELPLENADIADIYMIEGTRLADCLRATCAKVISTVDHTPELWATIIDLSMPYIVCLDSSYARQEFQQIWRNGGWNRHSLDADWRFEAAAANELRSCPRDGLPDETFAFAYSISHPFSRF